GTDVRHRLLAVSCLETCVHLTAGMRNRLAPMLQELVPPRSEEAVQALAAADSAAVPFLAPRSEWDDTARAWCVTTLARIGGEDALLLLEEYAEDPSDAVREALIQSWSSSDWADYPRRVLAAALKGSTSFRPARAVTL